MRHRAVFACVLAFSALPCLTLAQFKAQAAWTYNPISQPNCAVYSPSGAQIVVGGAGGVQIYTASSGALLSCLPSAVSTVNTLAFSPDGTTLAVGGVFNGPAGATGIIELWKVSTETLTRTIMPSQTAVNSVAFSPNGKSLLDGGAFTASLSTSSAGFPLEEWTVSTGALAATIQTKGSSVTSVAFAPNGKTFADAANTGSTALVEVWNVAAGAIDVTLSTAADSLNSVVYSPDGKSIADGGTVTNSTTLLNTGVAEIWNLASGTITKTLKSNSGNVQCVKYSPDGTKLADAAVGQTGASGVLELWNVSKGTLLDTLNNGTYNPEKFVAFAPGGKTLVDCGSIPSQGAGNSAPEVRQWTVSTGVIGYTIKPLAYSTNDTAVFSQNGQQLIVGGTAPSATSSAAGWIGVFNAASGALTGSLTTGSLVLAVAASSDGVTLADGGTESAGGLLELRNVTSGKLLFNLGGTANESIASVAFSPDGSLLAAGGNLAATDKTAESGILGLWTVSTGKLIGALNTALSGGVQVVAFSPDGMTVAAGGMELVKGGGTSGVVELWNPLTGKQITTIFPQMYQVSSIAFSPDGTQIVIGGQQFVSSTSGSIGAAQSWSAATGNLTSLYMNAASVSSIVFSPDSKVIYVGTSSGIESYSSADFTVIGSSGSGMTNSLALSSDGAHMAYTTANPRVELLLNPLAKISLSAFSAGGGSNVTGTITLAQAAPSGGMEVLLDSSNLDVTVPASVIVKAGKTSATFPIKTVAVTQPQASLISATAGGFSIATFLQVTPVQLSAMSVSPTSVKRGKQSVGTVALNGPAPANGVLVTLSCTTAGVTVPVGVVIPAGATLATFTIKTTGVKSATVATVTAKAGGVTQTATLTIN